MKSRHYVLAFFIVKVLVSAPWGCSQSSHPPTTLSNSIPSVMQFGAVADGSGDNLHAFQVALRTLAADKNHGARLFIPPGRYRFSAPLHINRGMVLEGASGAGRNSGTVLVFDPGSDGIVIDRATTSDDGGAGDWTEIRDLAVTSSSRLALSNGITLHARARIVNVYVRGFGGNGIEIAAWARGHGPNTNANLWSLDNVFVESNGGNGVHAIGADANAGIAIGVSAMGNGGWGFLDESFLGNTYVACHTENNRKGGYSVTNRNARSIFIGSYTESGQPENHIESPSMVIGGLFGPVQGSGFIAVDGRLSPNWTVRNQKDSNVTTSLGFAGDVPRGVLSFSASDGSLPYRLEYQRSEKGWWDLVYGELGNGDAVSFSTNKADVGPGQLRFPNGFFIGRGASAHKFTAALAPPQSGEHSAGEIVFSADPDKSGYLGWVSVQGGSPGWWVPFGMLVRSRTILTGTESKEARYKNAAFNTPERNENLVFDAASAGLQKVILHSDVTSSTILHLAAGAHLDFLICQDAVGGHRFRWPDSIHGGMRIGSAAQSCSAQSFVSDGQDVFATSAGATESETP